MLEEIGLCCDFIEKNGARIDLEMVVVAVQPQGDCSTGCL